MLSVMSVGNSGSVLAAAAHPRRAGRVAAKRGDPLSELVDPVCDLAGDLVEELVELPEVRGP